MFKRPFKFLVSNWETLLLAFLLSIAVWVSAVVASDPNREEVYPNMIPVEVVGLANDLQILGNVPEAVKISVRTPESLWDELLLNPGLISAHIDLSGLDQGEHQVPVEVFFDISPAEPTEIEPEMITLTLEKEVTKNFAVKIVQVGELALGYEVQEVVVTPEIVIVRGPESLVSKVSEVQGWVTITGARADVVDMLRLIAVDKDGRQISGVEISPDEVSSSVRVVQLGGYREVVVRVETIGTLPVGYRLTNISVLPPTITVFSSDPAVVSEMPGFVSTQPIDLRQATDDIETRLALDLPDGVVMVGDEQSVEVQIGIAVIETTVALTLPIQIRELGPGLSVSLSPETVEVFLTGPLSVLDSLTPEDVIISISLADLGVGTHLAEAQGEVLSIEVVIESINPDTIEVVIIEASSEPGQTQSSGSTPTPSPTP